MFGPLEFTSACSSPIGSQSLISTKIVCFLCETEYILPFGKDNFLAHIFEDHKIVIDDVDTISDFPRYIRFWKERFSEAPVTEYCSTIIADIKKDGVPLPGNEYYLLSDVHEEDKSIRLKLQNELLENTLAQQKLERDDTSYSKGCLFCRQVITCTRSDYIMHLSNQHNMQLGKPDNLVYVDELLAMIENKMENLQCIYCEKFFKDRNVLKEHMRKKLHKRINPDNKLYDKFYIVNYKGPQKNWKSERKRKDSADDEPCDWSDWQEILTVNIVCLFCEETSASWEEVICHMKVTHSFDYEESTRELDFYDQVKLVNYIRHRMYKNSCINCDIETVDRNSALDHMCSSGHLSVPLKEVWNQPEYYFPTYENDAFLCQIDDIRADNDELYTDLGVALSEINYITAQESSTV